MPASTPASDVATPAPRHVVWVAEAALGRLRKTVPSGGLVDDGDGFVFLIDDLAELRQILDELTAEAAYGIAPVVGPRGKDLVEAVSDARRDGRQKLRRGPDRTPRMAAIAMPVVIVPASITGQEARQRFLDDEALTTLVYADPQGRPVAALGRERLFRMFSGQYGYALFANRPVLDVADPKPRTIDADVSIVEAALTVANRESESLADDVLVIDAGGRVVGLVRVRDLLKALTSLGLDRVQHLNPLTGLPGSLRTEQAIAEILDTAESLVISRVDIAEFKSFNERAGFTAGDRTIQALGHAVAGVARGRGTRFHGHLGGDDFIVVWNSEEEAVAGAIEIAMALHTAVDNIGPLPAGISGPWLAVSTLVLKPTEIRDVATLGNRLAALKDTVRSRGGAVHAMARLDTIATPAWRSLEADYVAVAGQVPSMTGR